MSLVLFLQHSLPERCNVISHRAENWKVATTARCSYQVSVCNVLRTAATRNTMNVSFVMACGKHFEVRRMSRGHTKLFQCRKYYTYWLDTIVETTKNFIRAHMMLWYIGPLFPVTQIVCFKARSQNCEKLLLTSLCLSVRLSAWNNWVPIGRIFMKSDIRVFFENLIKVKRTFHEDQYTLFITQLSHQPLYIYKMYKIYTLKH